MKTHHKLVLSLILGTLLGLALHPYANEEAVKTIQLWVFEPVGQIFLRLIFMVVVPLVFSGLVLGVFQLGQEHGIGSIAKKTLFYTLLASSLSVLIGVGLVNILKPGSHFTIPQEISVETPKIEQIVSNAKAAQSPLQALVQIIPKNPIDAAARALDGEMLALMFFALFFGWALSKVVKGSKFLEILEEIYSTCLHIVHQAMRLAPYAVFCLVALSTLKFGHKIILSLGSYVFVVVLGLAIQQFGVYSSLLRFFAKISPWDFFSKCKDVYIYAFATASSNATLPKSLELAETKLNLNPSASRFVLTIGSTANQNGTALFEGITVLFLAQVYNVDLNLGQQVQVVLMSILAGIGTAGVPGGSLPLIMILLQQVGIPAEGLGLILGVDRFLDMCRTTINVSGDLVIAAIVGQKKS